MPLPEKHKRILCIHTSGFKEAVTNLYCDTLNAFPHPENIVAIIPAVNDFDEFRKDFCHIEKEELTTKLPELAGHKWEKIKLYTRFATHCAELVRRYDVGYVYFEFSEFYLSFFTMLFCRVPKYVVWLHNPYMHDGASNRQRMFRALEEHLLFPFYAHFILSYDCKEDMKRKGTLRRILDRCTVIPLPEMKQMEFADLREKESPIRWDFIFFGRLEPYKGLDLLLDAMEDESMRRVRLLIVGRGQDQAYVAQRVAKMDNIDLIQDYLPNRDLIEKILQSRFLILPYRSATGSQTIAIANYYHRLVLATKVGCFPSYIHEGKNGFFIPSITSEAIRTSMQKMMDINETEYAARIEEELRRFDIHEVAKKLYETIERV